KLAEADWLRERSGEEPIFLLDDVLSELDPRRREALVGALPSDAQVLVTAALPAGLPAVLLARATVREVSAGQVEDGRP
ncbi:MAG: DNA replication and repair protein RecF, partial [Candidatus Limnocylindria bacterium]|nr:DNA replication and repair protein RecF [Candidatus Limnocylindria bacterium]